MRPKTTPSPPPCPRCQDARIIPTGQKLEDGSNRDRLIVCPKCWGAGPVAEPAARQLPNCFTPYRGLKHDVTAAMDRITAREAGQS